MTRTSGSAGVIVGRFQVSELHAGHRFLIDLVREAHEQLVVVVGSRRGYATHNDPLPYEVRRAMIAKAYPEASIVEISDHRSDEEWSRQLDAVVDSVVHDRTVVLYGSRDSFLRTYSGRFPTQFVPESVAKSGTKERARIAARGGSGRAFRRGVIYSQTTRKPVAYPTVDIAIVRPEGGDVLLGRKASDPAGLYRFVGGFVDPADESLEAAAKREVREETSAIEIDDLRYLGSARIDDWRYRGTKDRIVTTLFMATYIYGAPRAHDDLAALEWVPLQNVAEVLVPEHRVLGEILLKSLGRVPAQRTAA